MGVEVDLTDERWLSASVAGQPKKGVAWRFKATPVLRERVNIIVSRRAAELAVFVTENNTRIALQTLKASLQAGSAPVYLSRNIESTVRQAIKLRARSLLGHSCEDSVQKMLRMLGDPDSLRSHPELLQLATGALDKAVFDSEAQVARGRGASRYKPFLRDLGWIFERGGGRITKGSPIIFSPFARWVIELLGCLPEGLRLEDEKINDLIRNMNWSDLAEPKYAQVSAWDMPARPTAWEPV